MVEPLRTGPIIGKLLEKTQNGRVDWEQWSNGYRCSLEGEYNFAISNIEDTFILSMTDKAGNEIFSETGQLQIFSGNPDEVERVETLRDLFELARRKALKADQKIASAFSSLERI